MNKYFLIGFIGLFGINNFLFTLSENEMLLVAKQLHVSVGKIKKRVSCWQKLKHTKSLMNAYKKREDLPVKVVALTEFDVLMDGLSDEYSQKYNKNSLQGAANLGVLNRLEGLYEKNFLVKNEISKVVKIPKVIHQIWVGSKDVPEIVYELSQSWKDFHPDWEYILWTNDIVKPLLKDFLPEHRELYISTQDPREKADILRYYLLYWYGGLYADADFLCLASFDDLHYAYDFYIGIGDNTVQNILNNGLIGCVPGHPIMELVIKNINTIESNFYDRSGVFYCSKKIESCIDMMPGINIALPCSYFYSYKYLDALDKNKFSDSMIHNKSKAIHLWASDTNRAWNKRKDWTFILDIKKQKINE